MQNFDFALQVMVIGFLVVIFTLAGLYGILIVFNRIFYKKEQLKPAETAPAHDTAGEAAAEDEDRRRTAAIVAAVYSYMHERGALSTGSRFNVAVQHSGSPGSASWHIIGRKELLDHRKRLEETRRNKK